MRICVEFNSLEEFELYMGGGDPKKAEDTLRQLNESTKKTTEIINKAEAKAKKAEPEKVEPKKADEKPKTAPEKPAEVDESYRLEVRQVLSELNKKTGGNKARELILAYNDTGKLTDVALADLPLLMAKAKEVLNA